jgi:alginate O-acetyltransferase complex protein AlgI
MLFNSLTFVVFFAIVAALHYSPFPWRVKKFNLLIASYLFYAAWSPPFVLLLWLTTIVDFKVGAWLWAETRPNRRKLILFLSILVNLGLLGYFKYGGFLMDNFQAMMSAIGVAYEPPRWDIIFPVGLSFYTFQSMSYALDAYFRRAAPTKDFLDYSLFVTFFPHLVAGPIVRPTQLIPQFATPHQESRARRHVSRACRRPGLRRHRRGASARRLGRHARVLRTDLLRFFRLHYDCDRRGVVFGLLATG